jgi:hypothetical protein
LPFESTAEKSGAGLPTSGAALAAAVMRKPAMAVAADLNKDIPKLLSLMGW